jgi:hypothetical protein
MMLSETAPAARDRVLAVLGDTHGAARVLEWSASLALTLERELSVICVESTAALVAASLPFTRVLAPAGAEWSAFDLPDVERAYRAQAGRLRQLAERAALRHDVSWSLCSMRGALPQLVFGALAESDLLFVGPMPKLHFATSGAGRRGAKRVLQLAVASDGGAASAQALAWARRLADALTASLHELRIEPGGSVDALQRGAAHADLLVLPRTLASPEILARLACPCLLVSQPVHPAGAGRPAR